MNVRATLDFRNRKHRPIISVIVAMYNCADTLERTLSSFTRQTAGYNQIEYIFIDDGSTDDSFSIAEAWARRAHNCVIVSQENQGVASARKRGLAEARGEWVTSVDPDDAVGKRYFEHALRMAKADVNRELAVMIPHLIIADASTGFVRDIHGTSEKFKAGVNVVDLDAVPSAFAISATTFLRRDILEAEGLTYDPRVRPTFEDGNLILRYLCAVDKPLAGLLPLAFYYYRREAAKASLLDSKWMNHELYTHELDVAHAEAFRYAKARLGKVPRWMRAAVLYDLGWFFREHRSPYSQSISLDEDIWHSFLTLASEILRECRLEDLEELSVSPMPWDIREALIVGFSMNGVTGRLVKRVKDRHVLGEDDVFSLVVPPAERIAEIRLADGSSVRTADAIHEHVYFGRLFAYEYTFRVPSDADFEVRCANSVFRRADAVDERPHISLDTAVREAEYPSPALEERIEAARLRPANNERLRERLWARLLFSRDVPRKELAERIKKRIARERSLGDPLSIAALRMGIRVNERWKEADRFEGAWLFVDRWNRADDNAEHLYRYIHHHHCEIPAYFMLRRGSRDWARLKEEGFRLLDYGSPEALAAVQRCAVVLSSDASAPSLYPGARRLVGQTPNYHFVFLQHGVTHNDLSTWLAHSRISLVLTTSVEEHASFCWRSSAYGLDRFNLALTGFPRFDHLLKLDSQRVRRDGEPATVTLMPSWRRYLRDGADRFTSHADQEAFLASTDYYRAWSAVLEHPRLRELARDGKIRVRLVAHPQLADIFTSDLEYPGFESLGKVAESYQEIIVHSDCIITDYSSTATDGALIGRTVIYYHFDDELMIKGQHSWRLGYFDYEHDGFGPVCGEPDEVVAEVEELLAAGFCRSDVYEQRARQTFVYHDANNCERATQAVQKLVDGTWDGGTDLPEGAVPDGFEPWPGHRGGEGISSHIGSDG